MKIYDKKNFWGTIIIFGGFTLFEAFVSYMKGQPFSYEPSLFIIVCTFNYLMESLSEEKTKINMERERQKKEVLRKHFGDKASFLSNLITIAIVISAFVMCFNFAIGLVIFAVTFIINNIIFKPVNDELRQINETAKQKKQAIR